MKKTFFFINALLVITLSAQSVFASRGYRELDTFAPSEYNFVIPDAKVFDKEKVLNDEENRVSSDFKISPDMKDRVSFWFDIYTKYSAQEQVIHHSSYPWIIFRVVDLQPILGGEGNKYVRAARATKYAKNQVREVRAILQKLAHAKRYTRLDADQQEIFEQIQKIPGFKEDGSNAKKIILQALHSVRTQVGQKDFIEAGMPMSTVYMKELEKIFAQNNLPLELTRLPFVESSFNVAAVSKVGASGIWQVMPYIGKKFLTMNGLVDERNSPAKSAIVAAYILKQNKQILKTWPLALTAYNHGTGSLVSLIRNEKTNDLNLLIKRNRSRGFGFASQNFYSSFLAILHAEKYKEQIFSDYTKDEPLQLTRVRLTKATRIKNILSVTGLTLGEFKNLNLDIRKHVFSANLRLPPGYTVYVPKDVAESLLKQNQSFAKLVEGSTTKSL